MKHLKFDSKIAKSDGKVISEDHNETGGETKPRLLVAAVVALVVAVVGPTTAFVLPRLFTQKSRPFTVSEPPTLNRDRGQGQKADTGSDELVVGGSYAGDLRVLLLAWTDDAPKGPYYVSYMTDFGTSGLPDRFITWTVVPHPTPKLFHVEAVAVRAPSGVLANDDEYANELRTHGPRSSYIRETAGPFSWRPPAQ